MINISKALKSLYPNCEFTIDGDSYSGLNWLSKDIEKPTESQVNAEIAKLELQAPKDDCKATAKAKLAASDWSVLPDVQITNKADFDNYRAILRGYVISPVTNPTWPTEPQPIWG